MPALKYRLLARFPDFFFCDPDYYPIGRGDEQQLAVERYPEIRADADEYEAITGHLDLSPSADPTPEQKLQVYREHKKLAALPLEPIGGRYRFELRVSKDGSTGQTVQGTVDPAGTIDVTKTESAFVTCPICLVRGTLIATADGEIAVDLLRVGATVWSVGANGERVSVPIERIE